VIQKLKVKELHPPGAVLYLKFFVASCDRVCLYAQLFVVLLLTYSFTVGMAIQTTSAEVASWIKSFLSTKPWWQEAGELVFLFPLVVILRFLLYQQLTNGIYRQSSKCTA
jgi:hypothetical protein